MHIGLVVDATCDLPPEYVAAHNITVLPVRIDIDGQVFSDRRDAAETQRFLDQQLGSRSHDAHTQAYSAEEIQSLFLEQLVPRYDCLFCLTITAARSPIHANLSQASYAVLSNYHEARKAAGREGPLLIRVIDTQTLFAGSAVVAAEAVRLIAADTPASHMRERLEHVSHNTYAYMLPRDLYYLRARAKKKGDRSVGLFSAALGSALNIKPLLRGWRGDTGPVAKVRGFETGAQTLFHHVAERIDAGLMVSVVCLSYGGPLEQLHDLPGYTEVVDACQAQDVQLLESPMSITGMVNVGAGTVTVGFACEEYAASF